MTWEPSRGSSCPLPTWEVTREQNPQIHLSKAGTWKPTCRLENYFPKEDASKRETKKQKGKKQALVPPAGAVRNDRPLSPLSPLALLSRVKHVTRLLQSKANNGPQETSFISKPLGRLYKQWR